MSETSTIERRQAQAEADETPKQDVPRPPSGRRGRARDALIVVGLAMVLLLIFAGSAIRGAGEEAEPGFKRTVLLAIGQPTGWVADRLHVNDVINRIAHGSSSSAAGGFGSVVGGTSSANAVAPVTSDAFDARQFGETPRAIALKRLLITGDSMTMPLDSEIARSLSGAGGDVPKITRDPHVGTGISKSGFVDWGKLSAQQVHAERPDAVVMFVGANEGFDFPAGAGHAKAVCCGRDWAAIYATRVRLMMNTYRAGGNARVYWLTLPLPRDPARQEVARAVNAAIQVAASPYGANVQVIDLDPIFTPDDKYRDSMVLNGREQLVRAPDGIHLNDTGAKIAAALVLKTLARDFPK